MAENTRDGIAPELAELKEVDELGSFLEEYGRPVLIGVGLGLALVLGLAAYQGHKHSTRERAAVQLSSAGTLQDFEAIVREYPASPSAPLAALCAAALHYDTGQYLLAQQAYERFQEIYPDHPMALMTPIGKGYCQEASGELEDGLATFSAFAEDHEEHFLYPIALLGRARCLIQLRRFEEAKAVYDGYVASHEDDHWLPRMESELLYLEKEMRAKPEDVPAFTPDGAFPFITMPPIQ